MSEVGQCTLLERIRARDASALGELYDCYSPVIHGLVLRIVGDRREAGEVLQEVFSKAWTDADAYEAGRDSPAAWLVRLARALALDRRRSRKIAPAAANWPPLGDDATENMGVTSFLGREQRAAARAVASLECEQRELIEEAYFLGLTQSELAVRHQLPLDTVKTRIRAGLLSLRQQLSQTPIGQ